MSDKIRMESDEEYEEDASFSSKNLAIRLMKGSNNTEKSELLRVLISNNTQDTGVFVILQSEVIARFIWEKNAKEYDSNFVDSQVEILFENLNILISTKVQNLLDRYRKYLDTLEILSSVSTHFLRGTREQS